MDTAEELRYRPRYTWMEQDVFFYPPGSEGWGPKVGV